MTSSVLVCLVVAAGLVALPTTSARSRLPRAEGSVDSRGFLNVAKIQAICTPRWRLQRRERIQDQLCVSAGLDTLAACLRAGVTVPTAVRIAGDELDGSAAEALREVARLLDLGADPASAWQPAMSQPELAELARTARRTARSGTGIAEAARELAASSRADVHRLAEVQAQRAAVWVSGPLGLCFLPAFLCLGVVPVVIGMAQQMLGQW